MGSAYPNLVKPLVVRGYTLKNRMASANSLPHFLQGPEDTVWMRRWPS